MKIRIRPGAKGDVVPDVTEILCFNDLRPDLDEVDRLVRVPAGAEEADPWESLREASWRIWRRIVKPGSSHHKSSEMSGVKSTSITRPDLSLFLL